MLIKQDAGLRLRNFIKNGCAALFLMVTIGSHSLYSFIEPETITYYLNITDFANSFITIPTSNVSGDSTTLDSSYLAGKAYIYDVNDFKVGTCSASFLSMQSNEVGALIYTDISNYLTSDDGLIVTWFTPTTLVNLELDSIINSMVTECMVTVTTKVGAAPLYGQTFSLIVSSSGGRIYFQFTRTGTIF